MIEENGSVSKVEIRFATGKSKPTITRLLASMNIKLDFLKEREELFAVK